MPRIGLSSSFIRVVLLSVAAIAARAQSGSSNDTTSNPILKKNDDAPITNASVPTAHRNRVISSDIAAQLSAAAPKFAPATPKPPPVAEEEQPDMREIDRPKNGIIRLPKYVVHEKPPPVLSEKVVNTDKGLADIAMKRYLSEMDRALNSFTLPFFGTSPEDRALTMYAEDQRLKNMAELKDDAAMVSATDKAAGVYVKRQADQTYMRQGDFDWKPIGK